MNELIAIFLGMVLINNFILVRFLGLCPFFGVSKQLGSAVSMGIAVTFVMTIASIATWLIYRYILIPFDIEYMYIVMFILPPGAFLIIGLLLALFRRMGVMKSE